MLETLSVFLPGCFLVESVQFASNSGFHGIDRNQPGGRSTYGHAWRPRAQQHLTRFFADGAWY